ncbi:MAG: hypothetical protein ABIH34_01925 [Nanoarchaeota archaeon]
MRYAIRIMLLVICLSFLLSACGEKAVCGNGVIEEGETSINCCKDTGCLGEQTCNEQGCVDPVCEECQYLENHFCKDYECCNHDECIGDQQCLENKCAEPECVACQYLEDHLCKDYECCDDNECSTSQICEDHSCSEIECGVCELPDNHVCVATECCSDDDCNDDNDNTIDKCVGPDTKESKCTFREKEEFAIIELNVPGQQTSQVTDLFYDTYYDEYDFLVVYTDFDWTGGVHYGRGLNERNLEKLRGWASMGDIRKKFEGPLEEVLPTSANGMLHELGHEWCCHVHFTDWNGEESTLLLQDRPIHWHPQYLDVGTNDPMGGRYRWEEIGPGRYKGVSLDSENVGAHYHYSDFTLYLMGLLPTDDVEPVKLVVPSTEPVWEGGGMIVDGEMHLIEIESVFQQPNFPPIPDYETAQRDFKTGFILWTKDRSQLSDESIDKVNRLRLMLEEQWSEATRGLSSMETDLV